MGYFSKGLWNKMPPSDQKVVNEEFKKKLLERLNKMKDRHGKSSKEYKEALRIYENFCGEE